MCLHLPTVKTWIASLHEMMNFSKQYSIFFDIPSDFHSCLFFDKMCIRNKDLINLLVLLADILSQQPHSTTLTHDKEHQKISCLNFVIKIYIIWKPRLSSQTAD